MPNTSVKTTPFSEFKPGNYSDGSPFDEVQYLECKIILKPDRFTSVKSFKDYSEIVRRAADEFKVGFSTAGTAGQKPQIREIIFLDTADFKLYNNAFILRRRIAYEDGFPVGDPEIVFKFRHPDLQKAAAMDVRPNIAGNYRIKFKQEALPLRDQVGGYRLLFSHNAQFGLSQAPEGDRQSFAAIARALPALETLKASENERIELVNQTFVEEVLQDLGTLDFGKGITAKANSALWRSRSDHKPLVGEFSFQCKFQRRNELHVKAVERGRQFFIALQQVGRDWVSLGTTKTGIVYHLKGNPPQSHE
ncbi:MAG: hypothetical protein LM550_04010 [Candidatus Contendobacter sp.]|jgi:hypothetical protein|nr:hypothetical protein [Gammaproteobacteria bacterium]MCC8992852.1 hypothetical protein [Candidatus Contendobacter sp.]